MRRGAQRWLPVVVALLAWAAVAGGHAAAAPQTYDRTTHAIAHVAVAPVHVLGAVTDASAPASVTAPVLVLLLVAAATAAAGVGSRRTRQLPARAPPATRAPDAS